MTAGIKFLDTSKLRPMLSLLAEQNNKSSVEHVSKGTCVVGIQLFIDFDDDVMSLLSLSRNNASLLVTA